jgi:hypothetical protein
MAMYKTKNSSIREMTLERALDFNQLDLEANRRGEMTMRQLGRLNVDNLLMKVLFLALFATPFYYTLTNTGSEAWTITALFNRFLQIGFVFACVWFLIYRSFAPYQADKKAGRAEAIQGPIRLEITSFGNRQSYFVHIGDQRFSIPREALLILKNGEIYTLYYAPASRMLLSAEPLDKS